MNDLISRQALCEYALNQKDKSVTPNDIMRFPSAQPETHDKRTETHACDCIERQAAIEALDKRFDSIPMEQTTEILLLRKDLRELPSAQPDMSEYSDKLWKAAYERGKAEAQPDLDEVYAHAETEAEARYHAERKKGKWITNSTIINCSVCKHCSWTKSSFKDLVMSFNYCPNCGADMRTPVETARDIVHEAIDNSVWSDTIDTAKMHKVVDDKYAEIRGDANVDANT